MDVFGQILWYLHISSLYELFSLPSLLCRQPSNILSHNRLQTTLAAFILRRHLRHSRHADEGRVAAVEEGAVDDLQDEGEVL